MLVDLSILKQVGSTNERLKEIFTAKPPGDTPGDEQPIAKSVRDKQKRDHETRRRHEDLITARLQEGMDFGLKNYSFYSAVDLAWEPPPISREQFPLMLYATEKIKVAECASMLGQLGCAETFVKKDSNDHIVGIDLPKFTDVSCNIMRAFTTRRLAGQANKFNNMWPYLKFESRATDQVSKLRADLASQRTDITADQYGWRHHDCQVYRDALLYGWSLDFITSSWEKDLHWRAKPKADGDTSTTIDYDTKVVREGLTFMNPHPSRAYWDTSSSPASINDDIGCEWIGFWDVTRSKNIVDDPKYFNRKGIAYSQQYASMFGSYSQYFSQYYCSITPPSCARPDFTGSNDRKNQIGMYSTNTGEEAIIVACHFQKIRPIDIGCGTYPYPVWTRFVVAANSTVVFAEFLPSTPAAYLGINQKDDRALSLGYGHELLSYQDQMSNLQSAMLLALKADNQKVLILDIGQLTPESIEVIRKRAKGGSPTETPTIVLEINRADMDALGLKMDDVVKLVETKSSTQITLIFQAMLQLLSMVERLMALSPQEQGQPAPREISAAEVNVIAGTTESVYSFISDGIDEFRAAKKRLFWESYMVFGEQNFKLPVAQRYNRTTIEAAGLEIDDTYSVGTGPEEVGPQQYTILGTKEKLNVDYIFTTRDGAERTSSLQGATSLTEMFKTLLPIPAVQENLTVGELFDMINELSRMSGSFDMKLDAGERSNQPLAPSASEQVNQTLEQLTKTIEQQQKQIEQMTQQQQLILNALAPNPQQAVG